MARRLGVSRDDVIAAAVRLSDEGGLEALTVAAVADAVGCRPPSVYHHVDGLGGLSREVARAATEDLLATLEDATAGLEGMDALTALVDAARAWGGAHPHRVQALRYHDDIEDPDLSTARAEVLLQFQDAIGGLGIPASERPPLVALLRSALRGAFDGGHGAARHDGDGLSEARVAGNDLLMELAMAHVTRVAEVAATR